MEQIFDAQKLITENCFMITIDISNTYFHLSFLTQYQKYLQFQWKGKTYKFTTLANGIKIGPIVFTKVSKVLLGHCRQCGIKMLMYIDDIFITAETKQECEKHKRYVLELLQNCGFLINWVKSHLSLTQDITLLGFRINSKRMDMSLTKERKEILLKFLNDIYPRQRISVRQLAGMIGLFVATFPVFPMGKFYYRDLEKYIILSLKKYKNKWPKLISMTEKIQNMINWWRNTIRTNIPFSFRLCKITQILATDSSLEGLGCCLNDCKITGSRFEECHQQLNINSKELLAIYFAIQTFRNQIQNCHILLKYDNTTALHDFKNMGTMSDKFRDEICHNIYLLLNMINTTAQITCISTDENLRADLMTE